MISLPTLNYKSYEFLDIIRPNVPLGNLTIQPVLIKALYVPISVFYSELNKLYPGHYSDDRIGRIAFT